MRTKFEEPKGVLVDYLNRVAASKGKGQDNPEEAWKAMVKIRRKSMARIMLRQLKDGIMLRRIIRANFDPSDYTFPKGLLISLWPNEKRDR